VAELPEVDVAIAGGGPVGCALALALSGSALSVVRIAAKPISQIDLSPFLTAAASSSSAWAHGARSEATRSKPSMFLSRVSAER